MKTKVFTLICLILTSGIVWGQETNRNNTIGLNTERTAAILDPTNYLRKAEIIAIALKNKSERDQTITFGTSLISIFDFQKSNRNSKFGYLMRHPTSANEIGKTVSEFAVHSAQFSVLGRVNNWISMYAEALYNPEQSFGPGTTTALGRNGLSLRRGFILLGDLEKYPLYAAIGKMDAPFGQPGSVNPFTNSTNWHAFGGLGFGAQVSYLKGGLHLTAMAIQGGAQFRVLNAPVDSTNVPSRLNNFSLDACYTLQVGDNNSIKVGGSYLHGTSYVQGFPVQHFHPGRENNPATAIYTTIRWGDLELKGVYTKTLKVWPGTHNPNPPLDQYKASKVSSLSIGAMYTFMKKTDWDYSLSTEFSNFVAGPKGSPWERQNQYVLGFCGQYRHASKLFVELFHTQGYSPLNFVSGGNLPDPGKTWSDREARSYGLVAGAMIFL